jgi:hypothetical protein|tara:strand:- start:423 stop:563 length:141 start_codon:yes stop_codon:yes gene_type:complete
VPKKRKLNSKNPKYWPELPKDKQEKVTKKLLTEIKGGIKVYGVFKQ